MLMGGGGYDLVSDKSGGDLCYKYLSRIKKRREVCLANSRTHTKKN